MTPKMNLTARRLLALGAASVLGVAACSSSGASGSGGSGPGSNVIEIGEISSLTGTYADIGQAASGGVKAAIHKVNSSGGVVIGGTKYTLHLDLQDDKSDPSQAGLAAQTLIRDDHVKIIFGPDETPVFSAAIPVTSAAKVIDSSIAYIAGPDLAKGPVPPYTYVFADSPGAGPITTTSVIGALKLWPDVKSASILFPALASYDIEVNLIKAALIRRGVTVKSVLRFDPSTTDYTPFLTKIKSAHPDMLISGVTSSQNVPIGGQAASLKGVTTHLLMFGGSSHDSLTLDNGHAAPFASGWNQYNVPDQYSKAPSLPGFLKEYKAANGGTPPVSQFATAADYYAPVLQLVKALEKAGSADDTAKIRQAMTSTAVPGLLDQFRFNKDHLVLGLLQVCALPGSAPGPGTIKCVALPTVHE